MVAPSFVEAFKDDPGFFLLLFVLFGFLSPLGIIAAFSKIRPSAVIVVATLISAVACIGAGFAGRAALMNASQQVASMPGLSQADRDRIVAHDEADASYRVVAAAILALFPLAAGGVAFSRAKRHAFESKISDMSGA